MVAFRWTRLDRMTAFEGAGHGDFVGVLNVAACGNAGGDAGDAHLRRAQQVGQPDCGGFPFDGGRGGEDNFVEFATVGARDEIAGAQMLGSDAVEGRERAVQDVEDAVPGAGLFDGADIGWLLDDAHQALIAGGAGAVEAGIDVGDVVADGTEAEALFDVADCGGKSYSILVIGAQDVKGEALRGFVADAGQLAQLFDEARHGFRES